MDSQDKPVRRISHRFFKLSLGVTLALTLLLAGVQAALDYRARLNSINQIFNQVRDVQLENLATALWSFDQEGLTLQTNGIMHYPYLRHVAVSDKNGLIVESGSPSAAPSIAVDLPLLHSQNDQSREIGTLHLEADIAKVRDDTLAQFLTLLFTQALIVGIVATILLWLFERLIIRHLADAAQYFHSADINSMEQELRLDRSPQNDEIDMLARAFNGLREKLSTAYQRQHAALLSLSESEHRFRRISESLFSGIFIIQDGVFTYANQAALDIFGCTAEEVMGTSPLDHVEGEDRDRMQGNLQRRQDGFTGAFRYELRMHNRDGSPRFVNIATGIIEYDGRPAILGNIEDITERRRAAERIEFLAHHDPLTRMPNRILGKERMHQAMLKADSSRTKVALLFLDLDNFKWVNDSLGHPIGDELLRSVAERLQGCVSPNDTISRQGGDEFIVIITGTQDFEAPARTAEAITDALRQPFVIEDHELFISASIGIALYPLDGGDFDTLLRKADTAMYNAKESGRNTYRFFSEHMNVDALQYLKLRNSLQYGLDRNEFVLHYQPQTDLASGRAIGVEALVRWRHPELGMVPPSLFIPVAEDSGFIVALGEWVLREACRQVAEWHAHGLPGLGMAVNLSAVQFKRGNLEATVERALNDFDLPPSCLELEITESVLIKDTDTVLKIVRRLRDLGVELSIDDFGTGYSSLAYLKRFSVSKLKIDRSFVRQIPHDHNDTAIVRAIIQMARGLDLTTIAEGVETEEVLECLREQGCDQIQGYYFSKPLPAAECLDYLLAHQGQTKD